MKQLLGLIGLLLVTIVFAVWANFYFDHSVDEWIYTWYKEYPELKPLSCEIVQKGNITWWDRMRFEYKVGKIQSLPKYKIVEDKIRLEDAKRELLEGCQELHP